MTFCHYWWILAAPLGKIAVNPIIPYNDLPFLVPQAGKLETIPVLKACAEARAALARLDAFAGFLPNRDILTRTIPLMEAQASSEIENIVTTNDELFRRASLPNLSSTDSLRRRRRRSDTARAFSVASRCFKSAPSAPTWRWNCAVF